MAVELDTDVPVISEVPLRSSESSESVYRGKVESFLVKIKDLSSYFSITMPQIKTIAQNIISDKEATEAAKEIALTKANEAEISASNAQVSAQQAQTYKNDTQTLKSETQSIKDSASMEMMERLNQIAALNNIDFSAFDVVDGELIVHYTDIATSTPSIVDGEFIINY